MGAHIIDGKFQSDKYPTCPPGKVPLSVEDETAQDLLWEYAQRRRKVDAEFADDLEASLITAGYKRPEGRPTRMILAQLTKDEMMVLGYVLAITSGRYSDPLKDFYETERDAKHEVDDVYVTQDLLATKLYSVLCDGDLTCGVCEQPNDD